MEVAIKCVMNDSSGTGAHFTALREIRVLRDARHANIVALLDVFARSQKLFLVYELCSTDLWKIIQVTAITRHTRTHNHSRVY